MAPTETPKSPTSPRGYGWILYVLLAVAAIALLEQSSNKTPSSKMPYSELKDRIAKNEVGEVMLTNDTIEGVPRSAELRKKGTRWTANRVEDPSLVPELEAKNIRYSQKPASSNWLSSVVFIWLLPIGIVALFWWLLFRRMKPGAGIMSIGRNRSKLYAEEGTGVTFADVAGVDEAKEELEEIVEFLRTPERFRALGGKIPKGVLLVGPPGTGKTLLARAVAGEAGVPFFSLSGSEFVEMFVGVGAARVRDLFVQAQAKAPCIIFIDELDAIGKARGAGMFGGHDEREQTLNQILTEMDGFDARRGLIVMGATNRPEILDSALMRPGRFDRIVLVDRPDLKGREAILDVHARDVKLSPDVNLQIVAKLTPGFAGAELANVINEAALLAARRHKDAVTMAELGEAIERVVAGLEKKNRRMNPREKRIVAIHEGGHALCAEVLPTTDPVHKISMIPRGMGALGFTMQLPLEDRYLLTQSELADRLTVLLGGRAAELTLLGELSTGAHDDLTRATDLARRMVREYGMSGLGPVAFGGGAPARSARAMLEGLPEEQSVSERTARVIDAEIASFLAAAHRRAVTIVEQNRTLIEALAQVLLEREVLEGEDLRRLLRKAHRRAGVATDDAPHEDDGPEPRSEVVPVEGDSTLLNV